MYKQAIKSCYQAKNWYRNDQRYIRDNFDDPELFAGLLSATSPRCAVSRSYRLSVRVYADFKAGRTIDYSGMMENQVRNIKRVLSGKPLSGKKVSAFYENLIGNMQAVTIDVWMIRFFRSDKKKPTPKQYDKMADRIRKYARKVDLEPAELQAICWTWVRSVGKNREQVSYSIVANRNQRKLF